MLVTPAVGLSSPMLLALPPRDRRSSVFVPGWGQPGRQRVPDPAVRLTCPRGGCDLRPGQRITAGYNGPGGHWSFPAPVTRRLARALPGDARGSPFKWHRHTGRGSMEGTKGDVRGCGGFHEAGSHCGAEHPTPPCPQTHGKVSGLWLPPCTGWGSRTAPAGFVAGDRRLLTRSGPPPSVTRAAGWEFARLSPTFPAGSGV